MLRQSEIDTCKTLWNNRTIFLRMTAHPKIIYWHVWVKTTRFHRNSREFTWKGTCLIFSRLMFFLAIWARFILNKSAEMHVLSEFDTSGACCSCSWDTAILHLIFFSIPWDMEFQPQGPGSQHFHMVEVGVAIIPNSDSFIHRPANFKHVHMIVWSWRQVHVHILFFSTGTDNGQLLPFSFACRWLRTWSCPSQPCAGVPDVNSANWRGMVSFGHGSFKFECSWAHGMHAATTKFSRDCWLRDSSKHFSDNQLQITRPLYAFKVHMASCPSNTSMRPPPWVWCWNHVYNMSCGNISNNLT